MNQGTGGRAPSPPVAKEKKRAPGPLFPPAYRTVYGPRTSTLAVLEVASTERVLMVTMYR